MTQDRKNVREKVTGKAEEVAARAEAKGLSKEHAAEVRDELRAKSGKAVESSVEGARHLAAEARHNKAKVAVTSAAAAVVAVLLAGWRIAARRRR
jgi:hypothetical protein